MAKRSAYLGSKNFFMLVTLSVSALGLMLFTYASQQQTRTQSDASGCTKRPELKKDGVVSGTNYVTYKYIVDIPTDSTCKSIFYSFFITEPSSGWYREYSLNGGPWISEYSPSGLTATVKASGEPHRIRARVRPPSNAASKTYYLKAYACEAVGSGDGAGPAPQMNCDIRSATYVKD